MTSAVAQKTAGHGRTWRESKARLPLARAWSALYYGCLACFRRPSRLGGRRKRSRPDIPEAGLLHVARRQAQRGAGAVHSLHRVPERAQGHRGEPDAAADLEKHGERVNNTLLYIL